MGKDGAQEAREGCFAAAGASGEAEDGGLRHGRVSGLSDRGPDGENLGVVGRDW